MGGISYQPQVSYMFIIILWVAILPGLRLCPTVNIPDHCEMYKLLPCVHTLHVHVMLHVYVHVLDIDYVCREAMIILLPYMAIGCIST